MTDQPHEYEPMLPSRIASMSDGQNPCENCIFKAGLGFLRDCFEYLNKEDCPYIKGEDEIREMEGIEEADCEEWPSNDELERMKRGGRDRW